jgi:hypothetical protein
MDRAIPEFNRVITKKWQEQQKKVHKDKVRSVSKRIDNELPVACQYPISNAKKEMIIECKFIFLPSK